MNSIKNSPIKKAIAILLAMLLAVGVFSIQALAAVGSPRTITNAHTVYFGQYPSERGDWVTPRGHGPTAGRSHVVFEDQKDAAVEETLSSAAVFYVNPLEWQVLSNDADGLLLITKDNVEIRQFNGDVIPHTEWADAEVRKFLNNLPGISTNDSPVGGFIDGTDTTSKRFFDTKEANAIKNSTYVEGLSDKVYLLSNQEVLQYLPSQPTRASQNNGYSSRYLPSAAASDFDSWGLRSHGDFDENHDGFMMFVHYNADNPPSDPAQWNINTDGWEIERKLGLRPVIRLDKSKIILTSDANAPKPAVGDGVTDITTPSGAMKLTLVDDGMAPVVVTETSFSQAPGDSITINYTGATIAPNHFVSAVFELEGKVRYYTRLEDVSTSSTGTATINLPASMGLGNYTMKVFTEEVNGNKVSDYASPAASVPVILQNADPFIVTTVLEQGIKDVAYNATIEAVGIPTPSITLTGVPAGLTATGGQISGTPTATGTFPIAITATNGGVPATKNLDLIIKATPKINTATLPKGTVGVAYSFIIDVEGDPVPSVIPTNGVLPPGLTLNQATGEISGTPTAAGSKTFDVVAQNGVGTNATKTYTLEIEPTKAPVFDQTQTNLPVGSVNQAYTGRVVATGDPVPTISLAPGENLPAGLSIDASGIITGTPTIDGTINFGLQAVNTVDTTVEYFSIEIRPENFNDVIPSISTTTLASGVIGDAYNEVMIAAGSPTPTFAVTSGALPDGLALDPTTGAITGTLATAGSFGFDITATNRAGSDVKSYTVVVSPPNSAPTFITTTLPAGKVGQAYNSGAISVQGNPTPSLAIVGNLPQNLALSGDAITGTPTTAGTYDFDIRAINSNGSVDQSFTIVITEDVVIVPPDPPEGEDPAATYSPNPMNFDLNGTKNGFLNISLGTIDDGTTITPAAARADISVNGQAVSLSTNSVAADETVAVSAVGVGRGSITIAFFAEDGTAMTEHAITIPLAVVNSSPGTGGNNGGNSGSGSDDDNNSGSIGADRPAGDTGSTNVNNNDNTLWDTLIKGVPGVISSAQADKKDTATLIIKNPKVLTVKRAKQITDLASKAKISLFVNADKVVGKSILLRIKLDASKVTTKDVKLEATINSPTTTRFASNFTNHIQGITFAHQDKLEQIAEIAVKLDLTKYDTKNLVIYTYNTKTNRYSVLEDSKYWIDKNGYVHFYTDQLYDIIISNGPLVKK